MSTASAVEREMLQLINAERAKAGISPLELELALNDAAERHSNWMLGSNTFSHSGAEGSSGGERIADADFNFSGNWSWGENIGFQSERGAAGISDDVADIHERLMDSPGHRANILNPKFDYVGIGVERGDYYSYDSVMITQNFASTDGAVKPDQGSTGPETAPFVPEAIIGTPGRDILQGSGADDLITAGNRADRLIGKGGDDTLEGQGGRDWLRGGSGADTLDGGRGWDRADYIDAATGLRADLQDSSENTGEAAGDSYISVEWLRGSRHSDELRGTSGDNRIWGAKGHDVIQGRAGDDVIHAGNGNDTLLGQQGNDTLRGDGGADTFVFGPNTGEDHVRGFENDIDQLDFRALAYGNRGELLADARETSDGDVIFDLGEDGQVHVQNVTLDILQDDILV